MSEEIQQRLLKMAKEIVSQDNAFTHEPIFMVQRHRRTYGFDTAYTDDYVYVTSDDYGEVSLEERRREYDEAMADEDTDADDKDVGVTPRDKWLESSYPHTIKHMKYMDYMRAFYAGQADGTVLSYKLKNNDEWSKTYDPAEADTEELRDKLYAAHVERCKEDHFKDWCDENENYTKTAFQDTWENVQPFFTRAGAEEYLQRNGHNLRGREEPRIYVDSAFRNAEWQTIREMLIALVTPGEP